MNTDKVHYIELLPNEFRTRLAACPVAYLPLGTIEWHGEHLPLGSDAIISEGVMVQCAQRFGGIVMPAIHLGPDRSRLSADGKQLQGMDYADVTNPHRQLDGSCYWVSDGFFNVLIDAILAQVKRAGFQVVFADGHGPSRHAWAANIEKREEYFGLKLLGVTPEFHGIWQTQTDHAAKNETASVMALREDLVELSQLSTNRDIWPEGVGGEEPRDATVAYGQACLQGSVDAVRQMLENAGILA